MTKKLPIVSVVIPCHNKKDTIARAINSVKGQTLTNFECIVVFDNDNESTENAKIAIDGDSRFRLISITSGNVADARNNGIYYARGIYICALDADDAIAPEFLEVCVNALEEDRTLGIAYTGITAHDGDNAVVSEWPPQQDYDKQLQRFNQIPTCNVFRRDLWERTGGYRRRYCPNGAGSEDAAFWTMFGAMGYYAKKVTDDGLFHYAVNQGGVSGNPEYREVDWLGWYPYAKDKMHPFASIATPLNGISHVAREYDEPIISIVIPVGVGHEEYLRDAIDSVEAQSFRQWEIIVVDDTDWVGLDWEQTFGQILKAYPFVRYTNTEGLKGAGFARNRGAEIARGDFLFFLDADDTLNVAFPDALSEMLQVWNETKSAVYTDYIGRVFIDDIDVIADKRRVMHRTNDGETWLLHTSFDYDCEKVEREPSEKLYIWNLISTLFPRQWHFDIGGFDESMVTWEDWDYWLRMAKAGKCFTRVPEPYLIYKFYTGTRRDLAHKKDENGRQIAKSMLKYMIGKHKGVESMACNTCGGNKPKIAAKTILTEKDVTVADDYKLVVYNHPNRGSHGVVGVATGTKYGYRKGGGQQRFLVHVNDIAASPHLFSVVKNEIERPAVDVKPVSAPEPIKKNVDAKMHLAPFDIYDVPGIGKAAGKALIDAGYGEYQAILDATIDELVGVKYINAAKADVLKKYAEQYK